MAQGRSGVDDLTRTQPVPTVAPDVTLRPAEQYLETEAGAFRGPRRSSRSSEAVAATRRIMHQIGVASFSYFVVVSLWWIVQRDGPNGPGLGVVAVGIALALANLVSLFVLSSLGDDRPDSNDYMTDLVHAHRSGVPDAKDRS